MCKAKVFKKFLATLVAVFILSQGTFSFASTSCISYAQTGHHNYEHHVFDSGCIKYGEWADSAHGAEPIMIGNQLMYNVLQYRCVYKEVVHECVCGASRREDVFLYCEGRTIYRLP